MNSMKKEIVAVVQARMGSTRFPGKSLAKVGNWSLIELVMKRINNSSSIDQVILATTMNPKDDVLEDHAKELGFTVSRGSEEDVLSRFYDAAKPLHPTAVVRITGDCPLISPSIIDKAVERFLEIKPDYLSLSIGEEKELAYPRGFDLEIASFKALTDAVETAKDTHEREHVTPYLYTNKDRYTTHYFYPEQNHSRPNYRLCVDTQEDFEVILKIYEEFKEKLLIIDIDEIIEFLDKHPEIVQINSSVKQKHLK